MNSFALTKSKYLYDIFVFSRAHKILRTKNGINVWGIFFTFCHQSIPCSISKRNLFKIRIKKNIVDVLKKFGFLSKKSTNMFYLESISGVIMYSCKIVASTHCDALQVIWPLESIVALRNCILT